MPNGGLFKRVDYVYSKGFVPVDVSLFGMIGPGVEDAPSDHAGILVTYSVPAR